MSRPTLKDVAAKAGLSVTQVSRALNDHDDVAAATKELARRVADELRYTPNLDARRLKDPDVRTGTIGLILPNDSVRFSDPFFGDLLSAIVVEAGAHGMQLSLSTPPPDMTLTAPYDFAIRNKQIDGFIIVRTLASDPRIEYLMAEGFPFVAFGRPTDQDGFPAVEAAPDCFEPVVDHLVQLGHRRVACLAEPSRFAIGTRRLLALEQSLALRSADIDPPIVVEAGFHEGSGYESTIELLDRPDRPTAIVAMNDLLALGALEAVAERGIAVPDEMTIVGFDDIRAARQVQPALTTVRLPATKVGALLVRELVPVIEAGGLEHRQAGVTTNLVIRDSSGPMGTT